MDYISFWLAKAFVDIMITLLILSPFILYIIYYLITNLWRSSMCKHEKFHEGSDCHAYCNKCHKNLGFIATVRKKQSYGQKL